MSAAQNAHDMVECPYNRVHRMLRKRLQAHLLKCRLSYPDVELQKCPFNQTHLVPEPEFVHHVTNCSDRKLITQYKYDAPEVVKDEERVKQEAVECDENWDDTEVEDYDPKKYIEQAKVLRQAVGGLPTERKEFIKQERKRLGDYNSSDEEEEKKKLKKLDLDRPHSSDEESEYVYSTGSQMTPPAPTNVQWFEDIRGRGNGEESITRGKKDKNSTATYDNSNRSRRSRSREDRFDQGSSGSGRRMHEQHNERNTNYALDDDPYYNNSEKSIVANTGRHDDMRAADLHARGAHRGHAQGRYKRPYYEY